MKVLLILFIVFADAEAVCRNGWVRFDNSCYLFITNQNENWTTAMAYCKAAHGHLAEIDDRIENEFIRNHILDLKLGSSRFWIGGEDFEQEGYWVWADRGTKITQTFWAPGEPNSDNPQEDCINLMSQLDYYWNDEDCHRLFFFICETEDYVSIIG